MIKCSLHWLAGHYYGETKDGMAYGEGWFIRRKDTEMHNGFWKENKMNGYSE